MENIAPDFKVIIEEILSKKIESGELDPEVIIINEALVYYLERLSHENQTTGNIGIEELERLQEMQSEYKFSLQYKGRKPSSREIREISEHELEREIRDMAYDEGSTLLTASENMAKLAKTKSMPYIYEELKSTKEMLQIEEFFDKETMSIHLKEGIPAYAKKGGPGNWQFSEVGEKELTQQDIQEFSREIIEEANRRRDGFIETQRFGSVIVQIDRLRIVITKPPFADGWEITAVRPVRKLTLEDYNISEQLKAKLNESAEGVLVAGSPGMGKTTFAAALAENYAELNKIVKTVEAPRDLVLPKKITQYSLTHGSNEELHDILLLSRPDYTIFDEVRNTQDFMLFSDLRLAGIGFIGVVHATKAIDSIQRFLGRIELGVIPQIIDTVIFIKDGDIDTVLQLEMSVKVPAGMTESDLARPVVLVKDFETGNSVYEIYTYGEQTVVLPIEEESQESPLHTLAKRELEKEFRKYGAKKVEILSENKCRVYIPEENMSRMIGKQGKQISEMEKSLGINIDVQNAEESDVKEDSLLEEIGFSSKITAKNVVFEVEPDHIHENVKVYVNDDYLLSAQVSKKAMIKVKKNNKIGKIIADALEADEKIQLFIDKK